MTRPGLGPEALRRDQDLAARAWPRPGPLERRRVHRQHVGHGDRRPVVVRERSGESRAGHRPERAPWCTARAARRVPGHRVHLERQPEIDRLRIARLDRASPERRPAEARGQSAVGAGHHHDVERLRHRASAVVAEPDPVPWALPLLRMARIDKPHRQQLQVVVGRRPRPPAARRPTCRNGLRQRHQTTGS